MNAKRSIMKHFRCSEQIFNLARKIWLTENLAECALLGMRFEDMTWENMGRYIQKAANELTPDHERNEQ